MLVLSSNFPYELTDHDYPGHQITVADLRTVFSRFGNLHSITLPLNSETSQPRGFSFIYFLNKSSATSAIAAINGSRIYAGMASERVASEGGKEGKKKEVRLKRKQEKGETGGGGGEKGRVVAVDWALGKDEYKKLAVDEEKVVSGSEPGSDESGSESDSEDEDEEDEDSDTSPVPVGAEDADEHHSDDDDDELDEEPKGPEPPKGTTLFVRNIVFEATEAEVYDLSVLSNFVLLSSGTYPPSLQIQIFWTSSLRTYRLRSHNKEISWNRLRVLLERRGCSESFGCIFVSQCWSFRRRSALFSFLHPLPD